jgi:hypothetical protein
MHFSAGGVHLQVFACLPAGRNRPSHDHVPAHDRYHYVGARACVVCVPQALRSERRGFSRIPAARRHQVRESERQIRLPLSHHDVDRYQHYPQFGPLFPAVIDEQGGSAGSTPTAQFTNSHSASAAFGTKAEIRTRQPSGGMAGGYPALATRLGRPLGALLHHPGREAAEGVQKLRHEVASPGPCPPPTTTTAAGFAPEYASADEGRADVASWLCVTVRGPETPNLQFGSSCSSCSRSFEVLIDSTVLLCSASPLSSRGRTFPSGRANRVSPAAH